MDAQWISDYATASANALAAEWFISPLEYSWSDGKNLSDKAFRAGSVKSDFFDTMAAPQLYKASMQIDFRAKMMVFAYMREDIAKTYSMEIESGMMSLYGLDFFSSLSQWFPVIEGYCRQLFQVQNQQNVRPTGWTIPTTGDPLRDSAIRTVSTALEAYFTTVIYRHESDAQATTLSRHLMLHGNLQNRAFFSQKNCLAVLFVLDALVFIEMVKNGNFPAVFDDEPGEAERISRRKAMYAYEMEHAFTNPYLLKVELLKEHV